MWRLSIYKAKFWDLITGHMLLKLLWNFNFQLHKALFTEGHKWTFSYSQYTAVQETSETQCSDKHILTNA